ncbi:hypothetical protein Droror1_Dr00015707 [Drosera rotundifolia]
MKGGRSKSKADSKLSVKKTDAPKKGKAAPSRKAKAAKDPNKPKRPPSAFFVFMEEFREEFKRKNPNNKGGVAAMGKAGGDRWRSLSDAEKAPYVQKAEKRKLDYEKAVKAYNKKQAEGTKAEEEEESEVHDEEDDDEGSEEDDED